MALDTEGDRVVVQGRDGVLSVWDVESGERERTLGSPEGAVADGVREMVLTEEGTLFHAGQDAITMWDTDTGRRTGAIDLPGPGPATGLWVSEEGDRVAASTDDHSVFTVWDAVTGAVRWSAPQGTLRGPAVPLAEGGAVGFVAADTDGPAGLVLARIGEEGDVTPLSWR
ncbi:PQQ-binding-like beta-propeller repeat protein [Nocardiopsis sp. MG754419]|uniref:PQQ-binding-like beta-propeller repeat protein n=1 Tax=Nocardiopsis sp. MG754419 TaxID=2259865 RepID=UPI001BABB8AC|nr:PQQ-binding-like beta-propeller repeat protein [Nocardiopsis sp. MG754419]